MWMRGLLANLKCFFFFSSPYAFLGLLTWSNVDMVFNILFEALM